MILKDVGFSRPHLLIENGKGYLSLNEIRLVSSRLVRFHQQLILVLVYFKIAIF